VVIVVAGMPHPPPPRFGLFLASIARGSVGIRAWACVRGSAHFQTDTTTMAWFPLPVPRLWSPLSKSAHPLTRPLTP
jgi:hypothetical protein